MLSNGCTEEKIETSDQKFSPDFSYFDTFDFVRRLITQKVVDIHIKIISLITSSFIGLTKIGSLPFIVPE
jgi:hypothetical protein